MYIGLLHLKKGFPKLYSQSTASYNNKDKNENSYSSP